MARHYTDQEKASIKATRADVRGPGLATLIAFLNGKNYWDDAGAGLIDDIREELRVDVASIIAGKFRPSSFPVAKVRVSYRITRKRGGLHVESYAQDDGPMEMLYFWLCEAIRSGDIKRVHQCKSPGCKVFFAS